MPTANLAAAMPALAKIEIAATLVLMEWVLVMGGGLAGHRVRLKPSVGGAIATHLQERSVANCSDFKRCFRVRRCERSNPFATQRIVIPAKAGSSTLRSRFIHGLWILDRPPQCAIAHKADDDNRIRLRDLAARCARGLSKSSAQRREGAGNAGCLLHPRSRVQKCAKSAHEHTGTAEHSGIPCAMVLRLMPRSPRRRIRLASVADGLMDSSNPVGLDTPPPA